MPDKTTKILPLTQVNFSGKKWARPSNFDFASNEMTSPLVLEEMIRASMAFPITFKMTGNSFSIVALQGLVSGENLLLDSDLKWIGRYVPAYYRSQPFGLTQDADKNPILCADINSQLISDSATIPIFDETGNLHSETQAVFDFLLEVERNKINTFKACDILVELNLLKIWSYSTEILQADSYSDVLYQVDETRLKDLSRTSLARLRDLDALKMIYAHIISLQHIESLVVLHKRQHQLKQTADMPDLKNKGFKLPINDDTLSFD